jgi:hypothetical protein
MRTETVVRELFTFDELSAEAKQKAIDSNRDINTSYDWWEHSYEMFAELADMCEISGFEISGFDLDRAQSISLKGRIDYSDLQKFARSEPKEQGYKKLEDLHNLAKSLLVKNLCPAMRSAIASTYHNGWNFEAGASFERTRYGCKDDTKVETSVDCSSDSDTMQNQSEQCAEACSDFLEAFKDSCFDTLSKEWDYLNSDEAIIETLISNDYEFTKGGKLA